MEPSGDAEHLRRPEAVGPGGIFSIGVCWRPPSDAAETLWWVGLPLECLLFLVLVVWLDFHSVGPWGSGEGWKEGQVSPAEKHRPVG